MECPKFHTRNLHVCFYLRGKMAGIVLYSINVGIDLLVIKGFLHGILI
jgi:hypothetical protein